jgi:hypothetical protein
LFLANYYATAVIFVHFFSSLKGAGLEVTLSLNIFTTHISTLTFSKTSSTARVKIAKPQDDEIIHQDMKNKRYQCM